MDDAIARELLACLRAALPVLERAATEEARRNSAPTGLNASHDAFARLKAAQAAVAKAEAA